MIDIKKTKGRAGAFYLAYFAFTIVSDAIGHYGLGTAGQVYAVMADRPQLYDLGLTVLLFSILLFFLAAWSLSLLLRAVDRRGAQLFLLLNGLGVAVHFSCVLALIAATYTDEPTALLLVTLYKRGYAMVQLFFSVWLFPLGILVYRSPFLPRFLGVLLVLDGFGILFWFLQTFLFPRHHALIYPGLFISFAAEFSLALLLFLSGVIRPLPSSPGSSRNCPRRSS